MPELPEVETVRRTLKNLIINCEIASIDVYYTKIIKDITITSFIKRLVGKTILDIKRDGKYVYCYRHEAYTEPIKSLGNRRIKVSECDNCVEIENIEKIKEIIEIWKNKNAEIRIKEK